MKTRGAAASFLFVCLLSGLFLSGCKDPISTRESVDGVSSVEDTESSQEVQGAALKTQEEDIQLGGNSEASDEAPQVQAAESVDGPKESPSETISTDSSSNLAEEDSDYFSDAVFIGDSLTQGFQLHGGLTGPTYYGFKNLNVKDVFEKKLVKYGDEKISIAEALRKNTFGKYYIMLGANELGWVYPEVFINKYGELIDLIRQENPEAKIYLQSVLPVSEETSRTNKFYSNARIDYYDELIAALSEEKNVSYLNVREAVQNENGVLPDEAATDGVHLNKDYCKKWADYLRTHK